MYIHNETGCVHVSIPESDFCIASRKGLEIRVTPAVALTTDFFELCGYTSSVEETDRDTLLVLKDEKQFGGDFTSCLDSDWMREHVTVVRTIEVTLFCESGLDSDKSNSLLCSMVTSLRTTHPLIFCPVQRSILAGLEVHCKNISESCQLLDIDASIEDVWVGILTRQYQLLLELSDKAWLARSVQGVQVSSMFHFVENDDDLTQDESFEMTDYEVYKDIKTRETNKELTQASDRMSLLTISNNSSIAILSSNSSTDILSDASNESMTLLVEWEEGKSLESTDSLILEQTFDTFVDDIYSDDSCV
ncbi:hypothetical protein CJU90_1162 [Yarrowia sp. C11]|nr:hypothetical protein CKK34_2575 [Yarrowia sp. E02]KAG5373460.1 hypothetical protein CJU90_1162 [Yarrowia sp. C11]